MYNGLAHVEHCKNKTKKRKKKKVPFTDQRNPATTVRLGERFSLVGFATAVALPSINELALY